jgi:putative endonuclease
VPASKDAKRAELGRLAETLVADHLAARGFVVLGRNVRVGRLEIDIVARRLDLIVFCEVRARTHDRFVAPAATIDGRKIARLRRAAAQWLRLHRPGSVDVRLDAASVVFDTPNGRLEYYEGAY